MSVGGGYQWSVIVANRSSSAGDVCIYQTLDTPPLNTSPVAWLVRRLHPTTKEVITWIGDPYFVWSTSASTLDPGVVVMGSQAWKAGLSTNNSVTLTYASGAFTFTNQTTGPANVLTLRQDNTIPANRALAGIGMDTLPTTMAAAQPNVALSFNPRSTFRIAFGSFIAGAILDPSLAGSVLAFPENVQSLTAIYNANNTWTIGPSSSLRVSDEPS